MLIITPQPDSTEIFRYLFSSIPLPIEGILCCPPFSGAQEGSPHSVNFFPSPRKPSFPEIKFLRDTKILPHQVKGSLFNGAPYRKSSKFFFQPFFPVWQRPLFLFFPRQTFLFLLNFCHSLVTSLKDRHSPSSSICA